VSRADFGGPLPVCATTLCGIDLNVGLVLGDLRQGYHHIDARAQSSRGVGETVETGMKNGNGEGNKFLMTYDIRVFQMSAAAP